MKTPKMILLLQIKKGTKKVGGIYVPKAYRDLFPPYKKSFTLQTEIGDIKSWISSKSKGYPNGCYIIKGLSPWFKKHQLTPDDSLIIEFIQHKKKYSLSIANSTDDNLENDMSDIISMSEGGQRVIISRQAERNPKLRKAAIKIHGYACKVCSFDFEKTYGTWGQEFIEVHHIDPLGQRKSIKVQTDPKKDLTVLCCNCHRMIHHKRRTTLTIKELKERIKNGG